MRREFITKKGFDKLRRELEELVKVRRPEVAEKIKEAVSFGDLTENAEYAEAKEEQAFVEGRILEIEDALRTAMLVQPQGGKSSQIAQIGCVVALSGQGPLKKFNIVGKGEGDPLRGEVSSDSPMGQAILGKRLGDVVIVSTPVGNKQYKITRIA
ncbi:MAG: transcription elongation factor GreA [Candidatus Spechtbacterales bacterium]